MKKSFVLSRLTSTLEEDHDVRSAAVDLFKIQRDYIAIELEGLTNGYIYLSLGQIWSVASDPVQIALYMYVVIIITIIFGFIYYAKIYHCMDLSATCM